MIIETIISILGLNLTGIDLDKAEKTLQEIKKDKKDTKDNKDENNNR